MKNLGFYIAYAIYILNYGKEALSVLRSVVDDFPRWNPPKQTNPEGNNIKPDKEES